MDGLMDVLCSVLVAMPCNIFYGVSFAPAKLVVHNVIDRLNDI